MDKILRQYDLSPVTGFIAECPLVKLPSYFDPWNQLSVDLPQLVTKHQLRDRVETLPLLDHNRLEDYAEWKLAFTQLSFIGNSYVWQDGVQNLVQRIPRQLAVPWMGVSAYLGLQPAACHTSCAVNNWTKIDPENNIRTICCFPGAEASAFFLLTLMIQLEAVPAIKEIINYLSDQSRVNSRAALIHCLNTTRQCIDNVRQRFDIMYEHLDADKFYHNVRPFITGWGDQGNPYPDGILYEGVSNQPIKVMGGSAAQLPDIQVVDGFLGIKGDQDCQKFLTIMRTYMTRKHAAVIEWVMDGSCRPLVRESRDQELLFSYNSCVLAMVEYRTRHIAIATSYIVIPSRRDNKNNLRGKQGTAGTGTNSNTSTLT